MEHLKGMTRRGSVISISERLQRKEMQYYKKYLRGRMRNRYAV